MTRPQAWLKRGYDLVVSVVALALLSPALALVAIVIKLDSPGPVFYTAMRCGKNRRPFSFYKFRTMVCNADRLGSRALTTRGDERVTRVGNFLRVFKIDELPQLWNVVKGDMSIVGPRPEVFEIVDYYYQDQWDRVLTVRPGLACLLQVEVYPDFTAAHGNVAAPFRHYVEHDLVVKLQRDLQYVRGASFFLDLKIILQTLHCIVVKSWGFLEQGVEPAENGSTRQARPRDSAAPTASRSQ